MLNIYCTLIHYQFMHNTAVEVTLVVLSLPQLKKWKVVYYPRDDVIEARGYSFNNISSDVKHFM